MSLFGFLFSWCGIWFDLNLLQNLKTRTGVFLGLVPGAGVEPACLAAADLKSAASTNFATRAVSIILLYFS